MKHLETIREIIERLLRRVQGLEQTNRRKSELAYSPSQVDEHLLAAEQNARDAAELNRRLDRL
jgi:hypothetical protein